MLLTDLDFNEHLDKIRNLKKELREIYYKILEENNRSLDEDRQEIVHGLLFEARFHDNALNSLATDLVFDGITLSVKRRLDSVAEKIEYLQSSYDDLTDK